ncbi:alpha/beta fold hydrolase [Streptomyces sp. NPDC057694]|uniref:alpha/beta fold hydrolase n=1 Tax=Streptomyces sp. NPDC057694 TaxID=3346216 RepID=UPI0036C1C333
MAGYDFTCRVRTASLPSVGRPIVLLGGALMDMYDWRLIEARLPADAMIITFDLPGCGSASELDDETVAGYELQARAVLVALDHLGVGQVDLLGYCYGAVVACRLLARSAERIARVVLANVSEVVPPASWELLTHAAELAEQDRIDELCDVLCEHTLGPRDREALSRVTRLGFSDVQRLPHAPAALRRARDSHGEAMRQARDITVPVLVICGAHDGFTPAWSGQRLAEGCATASSVLLDTGHTPLLEAPDVFVGHVMGHFSAP